jgi:hypothetical protein
MIFIGFSLLGLGLFLLVWASIGDKPYFKKTLAASCMIIFVGIILTFGDRIEEITVENIGSIKTAVIKANEEADEIQKIRKKLEGHAEKIKKMSEEATSALQEIQKVQDALDSMGKYGQIAAVNFRGIIMVGSVGSNTELEGWDGGFVEFHRKHMGGSTYNYRIEGEKRCTSAALDQYRSIIKKHPLWPFPYSILAICLKGQDDKSWEDHARRALEILEKTSAVPNHDHDHAAMMHVMKQLLQN